MMNMIEQVLGDKLGPILGQLQSLGLNGDQAKEFVIKASEETVAGLEDMAATTDIAAKPEADLISNLMGKIDINELAGKIGISSEVATKALSTVLPSLVSAFSNTSALGSLEGFGKPGQGSLIDNIKSGLGKFLS